MDNKGWLPLLTDSQIEAAFVEGGMGFGENRLGCDVAGAGRNFSVMVNRRSNYARITYKKRTPNGMVYAGEIVGMKRECQVPNHEIYIDAVGIGENVHSRVNELLISPLTHSTRTIGVKAGEMATDNKRYTNQRAEMYWRLREWILGGGQLEKDDDWFQLTKIYYKTTDYNSRVMIMSKEQMLARGIDSPDVADALSLTFRRSKEQAIQSAQVSHDDFYERANQAAYAQAENPDPYD
jgi:hypothetical protein